MLTRMKRADIEHLAALARLRLNEVEKDSFANELSSIVDYVSAVSDLVADDTDVTPQEGSVYNVFRSDEITNEPEEYTADSMAEMPETKGRFLAVKKILKIDK